MKNIIFSFGILLALPAHSLAKDCSSIQNSTERLSCYDSSAKTKSKPATKKAAKQQFTQAEKSCVLNSSEKLTRAIREAKILATRAKESGNMYQGVPEIEVEFDIDMSGVDTTVVFGCIITTDNLVVTVPKGRKN